jgi:prephenate dehydrogenase
MTRAVVVGAGEVGGLMGELLAETARVTQIDRRPQPRPWAAETVAADVRGGPVEAWSAPVAEADIIVLALPAAVASQLLTALAPRALPTAALIETMSVKAPVRELIARRWLGREALGVNPLFRPSLGLSGRRVAIVPYRDGPVGGLLAAAVRRAGGEVMHLDTDTHDRLVLATQTLPHAAMLGFADALLGAVAPEDLELVLEFAPPPLEALLALAVRIATGRADVYHEIQSAAGAAEARERLTSAQRALHRAAGDERAFAETLDRIRGALGQSTIESLTAAGTRMLESLGRR